MKKTVMTAGGFVVLGWLCYVGASNGQTQPPSTNPQPAATQAAPRTRIALINLTYVIKNYEKYKHFQEEIKQLVTPFQKRESDLRQALENLRADAGKAAGQPQGTQKDELERRYKDIQRQQEDLKADATMTLNKRSDEAMRIIFTDVCDAAQRYASSHDIELVLHYNDTFDRTEYLSAQNIARKLNSGALMPLIFMEQRLDISNDILGQLNYAMRSAAVPAGGTQPAPAPAGGH